MEIAVIVFLALVLLGAAENAFHQRALERIPIRILVNGTRGKTTVTRMAASVLNEAGIRTYAKTTGSEARWIFPDGSEQAYRREGRSVSIMEQIPFVRLAVKGKAQAIVVECMAQRAENQQLIGDRLIRPGYVLMTNAYVDHVEEIGRTEEETIAVLCQSVAEDSVVIAHDDRFGLYGKKLILTQDGVPAGAFDRCAFPVHEDNARLVLALARSLGIDADTAVRGMLAAKPDIGMVKEIRLDGCRVRNAFAANDPFSFARAVRECASRGPYLLLFNHREDRAYRLEAFARALRDSGQPPTRIGVIGERKAWCARYWQRVTGIPAEPVDDPMGWIKRTQGQVLCAGNIKGEGCALMEQLIKGVQEHG